MIRFDEFPRPMLRCAGLGRLCLLASAGLFFALPVNAQQIAITFDDLPAHGPRPADETRLEIAISILAILKAEKIPPTYGFVNGKRIEEDPGTLAVLKAWRDAGNPLGNHTWSHPDLNDLTAEQFEAEIAKNEPLLQSLTAGHTTGPDANNDWHWFRYPFLHEGDTLAKRDAVRGYLAQHGYRIAQVNMDFEDYLWNAPYARCLAKHDDAAIERLRTSYLATADEFATVFRAMSKQVYGRDVPYVLLMHLGAFDAKMLPELIHLYRARGFSFVSLAEAEKDPAYSDDPKLASRYDGALLEQIVAARKLKAPAASKPYKELEAICK